MAWRILLIAILVFGSTAFAQDPLLAVPATSPGHVKLFQDLVAGSSSSSPDDLAAFNGRIYFAVTGGGDLAGLWSTGISGPITKHFSGAISRLTSTTRSLFFLKDTATLMAMDPGGAFTEMTRSKSPIRLLQSFHQSLLFTANASSRGEEPWISDGTKQNTRILMDLHAGAASSHIVQFTQFHNQVVFIDRSSDDTSSLWKTNGTTRGTEMLRDFFDAEDGELLGLYPTDTMLFFTLGRTDGGLNVGITNGTRERTFVTTIFERGQRLKAASAAKKDLFLVFDDDASQKAELFSLRVVGNLSTDVHIADVPAYHADVKLRPFGASMFISISKHGLYIADATPDGIKKISNVNFGPCSFFYVDRLYFCGLTPSSGAELWVSDGTPSGTRLLRDIRLGAANSNPCTFRPLNGRIFFSANDGRHGRELWAIVP